MYLFYLNIHLFECIFSGGVKLNMAKKKSFDRIQSRNWDITTYVSESCIISALNVHSSIIRGYAYIYHDKFTQSELGDKGHKQPHFHLIIRLFRPLNLTTLLNWFNEYNSDGQRINTRAIPMSNFEDRFDYLTHLHDPDKYQYPLSDVVCPDLKIFKNRGNCDDDTAVDALNDLLAGRSVYDVCMAYGRDVIYHFSQIKFVFDLVYYGKEFEEVKRKNELLNFNRTLQDTNSPFVGVEHINQFK